MSELKRPKIVNYALGLILGSVLFSQINVLIDVEFYNQLTYPFEEIDSNSGEEKGYSYYYYNKTAFISTVFGIFILYKIFDGRNWARIIFLIVIAVIGIMMFISFPLFLEFLQVEYKRNILLSYITITTMLGYITGFILLFSPESNKWFKELKTNRNIVHVKVIPDG